MTEARASEYTMGYTEEFLQLLERRNVDTCANHLRPYLRNGMEVLDVGCGTMTGPRSHRDLSVPRASGTAESREGRRIQGIGARAIAALIPASTPGP